jgi:UDP-N-acetylglucosamine 2-epimerase (non-hydrolysing)
MIHICFGTRPEYLKLMPIIRAMRIDEYPNRLVFTGQHDEDFVFYNGYRPEYYLNEKNTGNMTDYIGRLLVRMAKLSIQSVLVQGDTTSAYACALSAFVRGSRLYHLEAGLRSYDLSHPYPEEGYRQMISRIADVHFAPTELAAQNLKDEGISKHVEIVGQTGLDNLHYIFDDDAIPKGYSNEVYVTFHRRENHELLRAWYSVVERLAIQYPHLTFICPMHPNPIVQEHKRYLTHAKAVDPMSPHALWRAMAQCRCVITDSGGLQEEAAFLNRRVIVCRKTTERPEGITSGHTVLCPTPDLLDGIFAKVNANPEIDSPCPYGDGRSGRRVFERIKHYEKVFKKMK